MRAGSAGQGRPQAARRGCIDRRLIWRATIAYIGWASVEDRLVRRGENAPVASVTCRCGFAPVLSPPLCRSPKQGAAPQRGDYATASGAAGRPRAASPSTASPDEERSGRQLCQNAYFITVCRQSGGAGSGGKPDKAGANCKDQKELFDPLRVQVRRTPVVPVLWCGIDRVDPAECLVGVF